MEKLFCCLCNAPLLIEHKIHAVKDDVTRHIYQCEQCKHVQIAPLPTAEEDNEYYQRGDLHTVLTREITLQDEALMYRYEDFAMAHAYKIYKFLKPGQKLLDIGAGFGWLVEFLRSKGFEADGVEISNEKRELCKKRCGIDLFSWNLLYDVPEVREKINYYDVVCLMHTLEHIPNPLTFLERAKMLVKAGGGAIYRCA